MYRRINRIRSVSIERGRPGKMNNTELAMPNQKFGIRDQLVFDEIAERFIIAEMRNPHGEATVALTSASRCPRAAILARRTAGPRWRCTACS